MAYRTKVEVQTNGKVYAPGSILPTNMSKIDMDFLKKRKSYFLAYKPNSIFVSLSKNKTILFSLIST